MILQGFTRGYHGLVFYSCASPLGSSRARAASLGFSQVLGYKSDGGDPQSSQGGNTHAKVSQGLRMFVMEDSDSMLLANTNCRTTYSLVMPLSFSFFSSKHIQQSVTKEALFFEFPFELTCKK